MGFDEGSHIFGDHCFVYCTLYLAVYIGCIISRVKHSLSTLVKIKTFTLFSVDSLFLNVWVRTFSKKLRTFLGKMLIPSFARNVAKGGHTTAQREKDMTVKHS